jgi:hypothetical protein
MARYNEPASKVGVALWIAQGLLALTFLFAGGMKLVVPIEMLTEQMPLPGLLLRAIGTAEFLGALGLILPGLLRIRPSLTPLAAGGLVLVMCGATGFTVASGDLASALIPFVVGLIAASVAYGRYQIAPLRAASRALALRAAVRSAQTVTA